VSALTGTSRPSRTTKLTQAPSGSTDRSAIRVPSADDPAATVSRYTPFGSSRSRTPSDHGSGLTSRMGTCSIRATVGTRLPWITTESTTTTTTMP
jgi:hypothetical protein